MLIFDRDDYNKSYDNIITDYICDYMLEMDLNGKIVIVHSNHIPFAFLELGNEFEKRFLSNKSVGIITIYRWNYEFDMYSPYQQGDKDE